MCIRDRANRGIGASNPHIILDCLINSLLYFKLSLGTSAFDSGMDKKIKRREMKAYRIKVPLRNQEWFQIL